jgi:hypothetical protein
MLTTKTRTALVAAAALFTVGSATAPVAHAQLAPALIKQANTNRLCGDLKLIAEVNMEEAMTADQKGDSKGAAASDRAATQATQDARKVGCGWAQP